MIDSVEFCEDDLKRLEKNLPSEFHDCIFKSIRFTDLPLQSKIFIGCNFLNCQLATQDLTNAAICDSTFDACNLMGVNWAGLKRLVNPVFTNCKLDMGSFQGLRLSHLSCTGCSTKEVDFSDCDLSFSNFSNSILTGSSFTRSNLSGADLREARNYFISPLFTKIKGAKFSLPEAITLIEAMGAEVDLT